jgi:hypothetical protein
MSNMVVAQGINARGKKELPKIAGTLHEDTNEPHATGLIGLAQAACRITTESAP